MEQNKKTSSKCGDVLHKGSSFLSFISMMLIMALFLRMESINRKTEMNEQRISKVESRMEIGSTQTTDDKNEMETAENSQNKVQVLSGHHQRNTRNVPQTQNTPTISLQQVRKEIDKKLSQTCTSKDKLCQVGPPGPPGDPGTHGYPGYKGEKGASGMPGPKGPLGPTGAPGSSGKQGRQGPQGIKGDMGKKGPVGTRGVKGDVGPMGRPGEKGSIGLKGNKGNRGYMGLQGPRGECIVDPKISIHPVSQEVFINTPAIFYCWVDGQTSKQITWSKLGGALASDTFVNGGVLHIGSVQKSHAGSYLCTVATGYGILRALGTLGVKELPVFTRKAPSQVSVSLGSDLELCCAATGSPRPAVEWAHGQRYLDVTLYQNGCLTMENIKDEDTGKYICRATNNLGFAQLTTEIFLHAASCEAIKRNKKGSSSGKYKLTINSFDFWVYCDMTSDGKGWNLITRFSNNDNKNWMRDDGLWWYDQQAAKGTTTDPSINVDMISPAFWLVSGREFKITRSDDPSHTPLLQTTGNCLAGQTFRSKITNYGDFRNGKIWASDQCLGSCTVQYGGQYKSTDGFQQAECSGNIQSANNIGFWCDWDNGDGSVMMIGGGGSSCQRADHGIGVTETDAASFVEDRNCGTGRTGYEKDFGYGGCTSLSQSYSLNLWIR